MIDKLPKIEIDRKEYESKNVFGKIILIKNAILKSNDYISAIFLIQSALLFIKKSLNKSNKITIIINLFINILSIGIYIILFKNYIKNSLSNNYTVISYSKMCSMISSNIEEYDLTSNNNFKLSKELLLSLTQNIDSDDVKLISFNNKEQCKKLFNTENHTIYHFKIKINNNFKDVFFHISEQEYYGKKTYDLMNINYGYEEDAEENLITTLNKRFIKSLDTKNSIIYIDSNLKISTKPKKYDNIKTFQININKIKTSIQNTFDNNTKRTLAIIGKQGTGKTLTIKYITSLFPNNPTIIISPEAISKPSMIENLFLTINSFKNCFIIFDDFDGANLSEKNQTVTTLLSFLDNSNKELKAFIFLSINDPTQIHQTIINRQERVDEIILINIPNTFEEVIYLLEYQSNKLNMNKFIFPINTIQNILDNNLSQVQITSIISHCKSYYNKITEDYINDAILTIKQTENLSKLSI